MTSETHTADVTLDCKGLLCPIPIVKLSNAVKAMQQGQIILLLATDPGSQPDVAAWEKRTKNEVVSQDKDGDVFRFWIRKTS